MSGKLGIVGAGKLGIALAKAGVEAGYEVKVAARSVDNVALILDVMVPGARSGTVAEVATFADIIVLALPLSRFRDLPREVFAGKILVDAVNYWEPVDGGIERFGVSAAETSSLIRDYFTGARLVKGLNQLGYHDVDEGRRAAGSPDRLGVAIAGDDLEAVGTVRGLVDRLGFDPVDIGGLAEGRKMGPGGAAFGATLGAEKLREVLGVSPVPTERE